MQGLAGAINTPLVVSCEPTICLKLLIPLVPEIELDIGVSLKILSGGGPVDFHRHGIDVAIRRNDFHVAPNLFIQTLANEYVGPVMRSDRSFGVGSDPRNFVRIRSTTRPDAWLHWHEQTAADTLKTDIEHQHHFLALEAAESGHGIALMSLYMVGRTLGQSGLSAPLGFIPDGSKYICISRTPIDADGRKQALVDWLKGKFDEYRIKYANGEM